jgi:hypothetical protein
MEFFKEKLATEQLSENTKKIYIASLARIETIMGDKIENLVLSRVVAIYKKLMASDYSLETKKSMWNALIKYINYTGKVKKPIVVKYKELYDKVVKGILTIETENEVKPKEEGKLIPYEEMRTKFEEYYTNSEDYDFRNMLLLANLLFLDAPTRLSNYDSMKIVRDVKDTAKLSDEFNYLVINGDKMKYIFNKYKTADSVGRVEADIKDGLLSNVLENYLEKHTGEMLLDMSQPNMTMALKRLTKKIYGVEFSVDIIRHSFITHVYDNTAMNPHEKQRILTLFGHKVGTTQTDKYYRKS